MKNIFVDIECYKNFFYVGFKRQEDGKRVGVEFSERTNFTYDREKVWRLLRKYKSVAFNSLSYDIPMLILSMQDDITLEQLKRASDRIIKGKIPWWDVEEALGIEIPNWLKKQHIDLIEPQPNAFASLKTLNGRMHGKQLQDLPYPENTILTHEQMDVVADYCLHVDLDATHSLFDTLEEPLALRQALSDRYNRNFMSKSDAQIGEAIVKLKVEEATGRKVKRSSNVAGTSFKYPVPDWMRFETPELQQFLEDVREMEFVVGPNGKVLTPEKLKDRKIKIGNTVYSVGKGGLHSTESRRAVKSTIYDILVDADVASQYPSIILLMGLYPEALGPIFLEVYRGIRDERLAAKKRAKEIYDELPKVNDPDRIAALKKELVQCQVRDKGGKIFLNGVYGKLGSAFSVLYGPHLLMAVTLTGQLTLLMLIEMANKRGIEVVSGNTDGVLFRCPRGLYGGLNKDRLKDSVLKEICDEWEKITSFSLEFAEYDAIYNANVNVYYALKANGGHKRKGDIGNPWNTHKDDLDPIRGQLMKNPQMTICSDAVLNRIKHGIPIEETIRACTDMKQFVTVIKSSKGATWDDEYLGKVVRYYWAIDGQPILSAEDNGNGNYNKVPKTDGARECMLLPDTIPDDLDYDRYIAEARSILEAIGFYGESAEVKMPRVTIKNHKEYLKLLMYS